MLSAIWKLLKLALLVLIIIGVIRGIIHWNNDTGGEGLERALSAIVNAVADVTYRWIGPTLDFITDLFESASNSAQ